MEIEDKAMVHNTVLEDHFDKLVTELQEVSSLLAGLGKQSPSDEAILADSITRLNNASSQLYFIRRDSQENAVNIEDLVNGAFQQATTQLIELRESRPATALRGIGTMVNVALRMATERLIAVRTTKE